MLGAVEKLLRDEIGLDSQSVGLSVIRHALRERMSATGIGDLHDYWAVVTRSRTELQQLINAVIVPETWFFRDRDAFAGMTRYARAHMLARRPIRLLSLPCSTGEEAYTMAMAMFDAGYGASDFTVEARDVSSRNLEQAELALYGRNSFRGADLAFRDRYFEAVESGGYRPNAAVRGRVQFKLANLFDPPEAAELAGYDIVFCRNLLIYFDRETQDRALVRLDQLLAPNGLLLVGPAESALPIARGFVSARLPMAFAFMRAPENNSAVRPRAVTPAAPRAMPVVSPAAVAHRAVAPKTPEAGRAPQPKEIPGLDPQEASLGAIQRAANGGRLIEAREAALAHIRQFGPSADAYYQLGLIQDAEGDLTGAVQNYRKAIYLAPEHGEALAHLALLLQRQGDGAGAKALNSRLGRMTNRSGS
jgi:chemotaxis protein methyltransferase WspC